MGRGQNVAKSSAYVNWYGKGRAQNCRTPRSMFDQLHAEYGFTLDGASEPGNGLLPLASTAKKPIAWDGQRVFCNPPWSNIRPFIEQAPAAELAVFLVPARTNVAWFHRAIELGGKARFFQGRPSFELPGRTKKSHNSPVDCLLLVFERPKRARRRPA
ncbi:DNA N-6-adenine-methyltransferase [Lysobacter brunescens]|uniref:DNA N-6-adenine-methyltransferase n=1 Tax=Lysobacter brunescens TaxID=262323 RepID=A0ABW2YF40_9GAMM